MMGGYCYVTDRIPRSSIPSWNLPRSRALGHLFFWGGGRGVWAGLGWAGLFFWLAWLGWAGSLAGWLTRA